MRRRALPVAAWLVLAAGPVAAQDVARQIRPAEGVPEGFCTRLAAIIDDENSRARAAFPASLADAVAEVKAGRSGARFTVDEEGAPPPEPVGVSRDEAVAIGRLLWARWVPFAPATGVAVVAETATDWVLTPAPGAPPADGPRVDKATGAVTWALPSPSERERLHQAVCGPG